VGTPERGDCIALGLPASYTGEFGANGFNFERAVQLAADRINKAGGVAGRKVCSIASDTQSGALEGEQTARDFVATGPAGLMIGPDILDIAVQIDPDVAARGALEFVPGITADGAFAGSGSRRLELGPHAQNMGCALAKHMYDDGRRTIAIAYDSSLVSKSLAESMPDLLTKYERPMSPVTVTLFPLVPGQSSPDFAATIAASHPDAVAMVLSPSLAATILRSWTLSTTVAWYFGPNALTSVLLANAPPGLLEGAVGIGPSFANKKDAKALGQEFQDRFDDVPFALSYYYYDAVALAALAIETAYVRNGSQVPTPDQVYGVVRAVASGPGQKIGWNKLADGLGLIRSGQGIDYDGISGALTIGATGTIDQSSAQYVFDKVTSGAIAFYAYDNCPY
jgi:branched-chain amino acid transport system substrate-binding protein